MKEESKLTIEELYEMAGETGYQCINGALKFKKPMLKECLKYVGIKYNTLSRTGKAIIRAHIIELYEGRGRFDFKDPEYYLSF